MNVMRPAVEFEEIRVHELLFRKFRIQALRLRVKTDRESACRPLFIEVDGVPEVSKPAIVVLAEMPKETQQLFLPRPG